MSEPTLEQVDPEIHALIADERVRQRDALRMIASENYASQAVMEASALGASTNKYAEGYAGKRYYLGQEVVDRRGRDPRD